MFNIAISSKLATFALNAISGAALVLAASWFSYNIFSARDAEAPSRVVNHIYLDPTVLLAGKPFTVHVNVTLNRLCPYEVHWSLVRISDGLEVVKVIEPIKQPPAATGTQDLASSTRIVPPGVEPGEYKYVSEVFDLCHGKKTDTSVRNYVVLSIR